jgi:hypothetical protein
MIWYIRLCKSLTNDVDKHLKLQVGIQKHYNKSGNKFHIYILQTSFLRMSALKTEAHVISEDLNFQYLYVAEINMLVAKMLFYTFQSVVSRKEIQVMWRLWCMSYLRI